jgi:hypothetical protein
LKYVCKGAGTLSEEKIVELARWARGKRFLGTFGKCYNSPVIREALEAADEHNEEEPCGLHECECGCRDFEMQVLTWKHGHYIIEAVTNVSLDEMLPPGEP